MTSGINTRTGNRNTPNPYVAGLGSLRQENPERFLSPSDASRYLQAARQAANEDSYRQQDIAQQNQQAAFNRQRVANSEAFNLGEQSKQNDFNRRMQEKEYDSKQANRSTSFTIKTDDSGQINFNRQKQLMQMQYNQETAKSDRDRYNQQLLETQRQSNDRTMQAAQLAAQQRLAQTQQDTAILAGSYPGESTWRWF